MNKIEFEKRRFFEKRFYNSNRISTLTNRYFDDLDGVSFAEAWKNKKKVMVEKVPVFFIGYNQLLEVKRKSARPQDLADIYNLEKKRNKK